MASKKELVEAHSFSRRRLVTAFVSGAPGGREVEPAKPGRTLVGGLALAVLLIAGAAVAGIFSGRTAVDWDSQGLVLSKETGQLYVIPEDGADLHPVVNMASARLILGESDVEPTTVKDEEIRKRRPGSVRGILDAPSVLPLPGDLIDEGWTACTDTGQGIRLNVADQPGAQVLEGRAFVVTTGKGEFYLLAQPGPTAAGPSSAYSLELPSGNRQKNGQRDDFLSRLGLPVGKQAVAVSNQFLRLFPVGGPISLKTMGMSGPTDASASTDGDRTWLETDRGPVLMDPFSIAAYQALTGREPRKTNKAPAEAQEVGPFEAAHWPSSAPAEGLGGPCAVLQAGAGEEPRALLGQSPSGDASPEETAEGERDAVVQAGRGAYVQSGSWGSDSGGEPFLIDTNALRYPLVGAGAADALGYADVEPAVVPDTWVELFEAGTELSHERAACPPTHTGGQACG